MWYKMEKKILKSNLENLNDKEGCEVSEGYNLIGEIYRRKNKYRVYSIPKYGGDAILEATYTFTPSNKNRIINKVIEEFGNW